MFDDNVTMDTAQNVNNQDNVRNKDLTENELEDEDDEYMDESVNQDNDENEEDDKDDLDTSSIDKTDARSNSNSHKTGNASIHTLGQLTSTLSTKTNRRKNKRKQFKPRNILYDGNEEDMEEESNKYDNGAMEDSEHGSDQLPLNLSGHNGNGGNVNRMLLPRKMLEQQLLSNQRGESDHGSSSNAASSPMDLSNYQTSDMEQNRNFSGSNEDRNSNSEDAEGRERIHLIDDTNSDGGCDDGNKTHSNSVAKGLSVVRPEVLFGENNSSSVTSGSPTSSPGITAPPTSQPLPFGGASFPPALMPLLGLPGAGTKTSPGAGLPSSDAMKEAFQEVLKLYGVPSELAEAIAKNAQNTQGKLF